MRAFGVTSLPRGGLAALAMGLLLAGCASSPRPGRATARRPGAAPIRRPASRACPTPKPRIDPIRPGGANKPYQALGRDYVPMTRDIAFSERGLASWYGRQFHGRRTASGETYDMYAMTAAHPTLPIPSYARIRNPANGREVIVRVNDRGPFHAGRIVDLSYAAALRLDLLRGVAPVELERITFDEIRAGSLAARRAGRDPPGRGGGVAREARRRRAMRRARPAARPDWSPSRPCPRRPLTPPPAAAVAAPVAATAIAPSRARVARPPGARLLGAARRVSRVGRCREFPAPGRRRGRMARAAARDLRRCGAVSRPGRPVREPRRGARRGGPGSRGDRAGAADRRAALSVAACVAAPPWTIRPASCPSSSSLSRYCSRCSARGSSPRVIGRRCAG